MNALQNADVDGFKKMGSGRVAHDPNANGGYARKMAQRNAALNSMAQGAVRANRFAHTNAVNRANSAYANAVNSANRLATPSLSNAPMAKPDQREGEMNRSMGTPKKVDPTAVLDMTNLDTQPTSSPFSPLRPIGLPQ